ncbi:MAG: pyruvate dehydrogenase (acetyl-transferring) E1 component subunit alpha [Actinomycetota bacterium]|nr:pyruvate dehydrogenase (acetyl-transferring) E1 component subunit alpha [Actinomycetota bacterium]MDH4016058.1 pyruvate dehydrogenase (acetyl-transferring) E1 component subunit alpha [Actinomycetota bacterium]
MAIDGGPDLIQLLTPEGLLNEHPDHGLTLTDEQWRDRYTDLVMVRRLDTEATALQRHGELGLWAPCQGQEAAQVGAARATRSTDRIFPTYREHGMAYVRGVDPATLLGLFRGTTLGGWDPAEHGFSLYTVVIGDQTLHAVGYAMGIQRDGTDDAVLVCFGDGASSQGDVAEAFVYAAVADAPVVFFCQNNQWAISEPLERQTRIPLFKRAAGYGFPGVRVDGNDVLAVEAVVTWALERARRGEGPTLVEAFTYRMGAHTTSDDPSRYRTTAEGEAWKLKDPIERVRAHISRSGIADPAFLAEVDIRAGALGEHMRSACRAMPDPSPTSMFDHLYATDHPVVDHDRAWLTAYLAGFSDSGRGH